MNELSLVIIFFSTGWSSKKYKESPPNLSCKPVIFEGASHRLPKGGQPAMPIGEWMLSWLDFQHLCVGR